MTDDADKVVLNPIDLDVVKRLAGDEEFAREWVAACDEGAAQDLAEHIALVERLTKRRDKFKEWLLESGQEPNCFDEQNHTQEGARERVYWHYGYMVALRDVLRQIAPYLEAQADSFTEAGRHEGRCDDCGGVNPAWFAPNAIWNLVIGGPDAEGDPGGFICPVCFIERAEASPHMPFVTGWKMAPEDDDDHAQAERIFALEEELRARESDRSGEAIETRSGSTEGESAVLAEHSPDLLSRLIAKEAECIRMRSEMRALYRGYVTTLEHARNRILELGAHCDPLAKMEEGDPVLIRARESLALGMKEKS